MEEELSDLACREKCPGKLSELSWPRPWIYCVRMDNDWKRLDWLGLGGRRQLLRPTLLFTSAISPIKKKALASSLGRGQKGDLCHCDREELFATKKQGQKLCHSSILDKQPISVFC